MPQKSPNPAKVKPIAKNRVFKTAWFTKEARKAKITDTELCRAMSQVMQGQADDLGGGVYKKRLNDNLHRSIILTKAGRYWIYAYLYAKKIVTISHLMNWLDSKNWLKITAVRAMPTLKYF